MTVFARREAQRWESNWGSNLGRFITVPRSKPPRIHSAYLGVIRVLLQMPQLFFIGGTGHVGGAVLDRLVELHPNVLVKVLVRTQGKASRLMSKYPKVQTVIGALDSFDEIESSCRAADIVVNTAPDVTHEASYQVILRGMKSRETKGYYIHTSGASLIWDEPKGSKDARVWDDIGDIGDLTSMDVTCTHSATDKIVREAAQEINIAIISPGGVGGLSPSIEHPTPITTPGILLTARAFNSGFQIDEGQNRHSWIHVLDIAEIYLKLIGHALDGNATVEGLQLWGPEAYYFATSEEISFADFITGLVPVLHKHGVIQSTEIKPVSVIDAARASIWGKDYKPDAAPPPEDSWAMHISILYGINMRIRGSRMFKLGWMAERGSVVDTFEDVIAAHLALEQNRGKE
ncbi:uncharacterized protein BCR38DRAFT_450167 [Pseudomassariella vexata]|uniref:NAD(P)-binding domain-containing protein n=1 Tax=Pseudomassariella vexata TaxID=1141098 RepID=A0A1Y2DC32_9PEZI|nr:uncharacterized protein BCR38DRAFT_450167 [Pseudomassariella vexata]ORY56832.1 hypothetical protein BCR38DRAFT_450167 [Pseudomassariella vexata]